MALRIFLRVIAQSLQAHSPGAENVDKAALHIGAGAFILRFGSSLNVHVHFYGCVVDGVFEAVAGDQVRQDQTSRPSIVFTQTAALMRLR
jgi:Putative transposase